MTIVSEVGRRMLIPAENILARSRKPDNSTARFATWLSLSMLGLNPAEIARLWGYNHSSVVHGLQRARDNAYMSSVARLAADLCGHGGARAALHLWLERELPPLEVRDRAAIEAYAACALLGWERRPGVTCAYGLMLVMTTPGVRAALEEALKGCDQASTIGLIELQAAQYRRRAG